MLVNNWAQNYWAVSTGAGTQRIQISSMSSTNCSFVKQLGICKSWVLVKPDKKQKLRAAHSSHIQR